MLGLASRDAEKHVQAFGQIRGVRGGRRGT
jgi:hypothetical protein